jgi:outer membrane protein
MPDRELAAWIADADARKDLEAARSMLRAGELEEQVRRAVFRPRIGVVARGDLVDDTLFGDHGSSTALMAVASVNLFAGGSDRAALAVARYKVQAGRQDVQRFEEGVELAVRKAFEEAGTALARHETAVEAVRTARETERITQERFSAGVVKMIDLIDATTALREAETRELVSRAGATAALLQLAVQSGANPESVLP